MTYIAGGDIQANDYNTFSTAVGGMNEIFADLHTGATTLPNASYGYGQTPALIGVLAGDDIAAAEWTSLFQTMRACGTHQGTTVVPPLPVANPSTGDMITAYANVSTLISTLKTNRFVVAALQSTLIVGANHTQPGPTIPWTNSLTFNFQVDFGSWNNARYFFNSGGSLNINGSYSPSVTPEDAQWISMLSDMSPLVVDAMASTPNTGSNTGTAAGFYGLTTSYQSVYEKLYGGGGAYSTSYIKLEAKLNAIAGTNGLIDFSLTLVDGDITSNVKNGTTVYRIDNVAATGVIVYPGPAVSIASVGANSGFIST